MYAANQCSEIAGIFSKISNQIMRSKSQRLGMQGYHHFFVLIVFHKRTFSVSAVMKLKTCNPGINQTEFKIFHCIKVGLSPSKNSGFICFIGRAFTWAFRPLLRPTSSMLNIGFWEKGQNGRTLRP